MIDNAIETSADEAAWRRRVWQLAWPVILSNMSLSALAAVDTAVMGRLPDPAYIGGVAIGATIIGFIYWTVAFLRMGTTGFTAQALGAGDREEVQALVRRSLVLALAVAAILIAIGPLLFRLALDGLGPSEAVRAFAKEYTAIRVWGFPASLGNVAVLGWLVGLQRMRLALSIQVALNLLNAVLAITFVLGLGWAVPGAAYATLTAEWFGLALSLWAVRRVGRELGAHASAARIFDLPRLLALLRVNANVFIRSLLLTAAQAHFAMKGARFGDTVLAANSILIAIHSMLGMGIDGFAVAAETLVGNALGRRDRAAFDRAVRAAARWAIAVAAIFALAYGVLGGLVIALMTSLPDVQDVALEFLPWSVAVPIALVWGYMLDGFFNGATRAADMRNAIILCVCVYAAAYAVLVPRFGNHGLWASFFLLQAARAATLGALFPRLARSVGPKVA